MPENNEEGFEELVKKRQDLGDKLKKLEKKKETAKEKIYLKVKTDYEKRLEDINRAIKEQASFAEERVSKLQEEEEVLKEKRESYADRVAELKLRFELGEFEEAEYDDILEGEEKKLGEIDKSLDNIKDEIVSMEGLIKEKKKEKLEVAEEVKAKEIDEEVTEEKLPEAAEVEKEKAEEKEEEERVNVQEKEFVEAFASVDEEKAEETKIAESIEESIDDLLKESETSKEPAETVEEESIASEIIPEGEAVKEETSKLEGFAEDKGELATEEEEEDSEKAEEEEAEVEGLKCLKCGFVNSKDSWYCEKCGSELLQ